MRRAWAALVLAAWAGMACAAPPPRPAEERERLAALQQAGRDRQEGVLGELVNARDIPGVRSYAFGFMTSPKGNESPLPASIESLIVAHFADPEFGSTLASLVGGGTYSSHRLFVLLNGVLRDSFAAGRTPRGLDRPATLIVRTSQPGIEESIFPLTKRYCAIAPPALPQRGMVFECRELLDFAAKRKHEPARAWMAAQLAASPEIPGEILWMMRALGLYGDRQSADLLLALFEAAAAAPPSRQVAFRASSAMEAMKDIDRSVPIDYARLRRAMKAMGPRAPMNNAFEVVRLRGDSRGVGLLVDGLGTERPTGWYPEVALTALGSLRSPEAWTMARDQLLELKRAGPLNPMQEKGLALVSGSLQTAERDAVWERQAREKEAVREAARKREAGRVAPLAEARRLASPQPAEASKHYRRFIEALLVDARFRGSAEEVRAIRAELQNAVDEASRFDRYSRRDPRAAIEALRLSLKAPPPGPREPDPRVERHVQIADILHFDLGDREAAAREFDAAAAVVRRDWKEDEFRYRTVIDGTLEWLAAESAFLRQGKTVGGPPSDGLRSAIGMSALYGSPPELREIRNAMTESRKSGDAALRAKIHAILQGLPQSRGNMEGLLSWLGVFPDEASLRRFVEKHDPAGARTLVVLSILVRTEQLGGCDDKFAWELLPWICDDRTKPHPIIGSARRILASRGVPEPAAADGRLSTPEGTWSVFIGALRAADRNAALACMTPELRERFRGALQALDTARLRAMADEFSPLTMGKSMGLFQEATVVRDREGRKQAALVYFLRQGREWRINEM